MNNEKVNERQVIETGIVFGIAGIILGLYTTSNYWFIAAIGMLLFSLLTPVLLKPFALIWFGISKALGWLTSRVLLFIIFFIMVTPVGIIRKILGKDSLAVRNFKKDGTTAYTVREHEFSAEDLKYPF